MGNILICLAFLAIGAIFSPILIKLAKMGYNYLNKKINKLDKYN